jgi:hypothetical protein
MRKLLATCIVLVATLPSQAAAADGTIAFHQKTFDDSSSDLWLAAADGSTGAVRLTGPQSPPDPSACWDGGCGAEYPDWTPDGSRIYFDSSWTPFIHIWSIRPDGSDPVQETFSTGFDGLPAISADGSLIAYDFSSDEDPGLNGIYVKPRVGPGAAVRLTVGPKRGFDTNPTSHRTGRRWSSSAYSGTSARRRDAADGGRPASPLRSGWWAPTAAICTRSSAAARSGAIRTTARTGRGS